MVKIKSHTDKKNENQFSLRFIGNHSDNLRWNFCENIILKWEYNSIDIPLLARQMKQPSDDQRKILKISLKGLINFWATNK